VLLGALALSTVAFGGVLGGQLSSDSTLPSAVGRSA
jgi:hypothetical protein